MNKTISVLAGILIIVFVVGVAGASVLFFNQDSDQEIEFEESFVIVGEVITKDDLEETEEIIDEVEVSVCDIVNNTALYINKVIQVNGIVKFTGEHFLDNEYLLEDDNCQIQVSSWAPISVAQCPPGVEICNPPLIMNDYLDKKVKVDGILKEVSKEEYINSKWVVVGTYYIIANVNNAQILEQ